MAPAARHVPDAANPAPDSDRPGYPIPGPRRGRKREVRFGGPGAAGGKAPGSRTGNAVDQGPGDDKMESRPGSRTKNIPWGRRKPGHALFIYGAGAAL